MQNNYYDVHKPSSIKLEVYLDKLIHKKIDTIDLEIPEKKSNLSLHALDY